jgi:hypothetical protein
MMRNKESETMDTIERELIEHLADYEKEISEVIAHGAYSRKHALLWMLDTDDGNMPANDHDIDSWMFNRGISGEIKVKDELIKAMKPIWSDARNISV